MKKVFLSILVFSSFALTGKDNKQEEEDFFNSLNETERATVWSAKLASGKTRSKYINDLRKDPGMDVRLLVLSSLEWLGKKCFFARFEEEDPDGCDLVMSQVKDLKKLLPENSDQEAATEETES